MLFTQNFLTYPNNLSGRFLDEGLTINLAVFSRTAYIFAMKMHINLKVLAKIGLINTEHDFCELTITFSKTFLSLNIKSK